MRATAAFGVRVHDFVIPGATAAKRFRTASTTFIDEGWVPHWPRTSDTIGVSFAQVFERRLKPEIIAAVTQT